MCGCAAPAGPGPAGGLGSYFRDHIPLRARPRCPSQPSFRIYQFTRRFSGWPRERPSPLGCLGRPRGRPFLGSPPLTSLPCRSLSARAGPSYHSRSVARRFAVSGQHVQAPQGPYLSGRDLSARVSSSASGLWNLESGIRNLNLEILKSQSGNLEICEISWKILKIHLPYEALWPPGQKSSHVVHGGRLKTDIRPCERGPFRGWRSLGPGSRVLLTTDRLLVGNSAGEFGGGQKVVKKW